MNKLRIFLNSNLFIALIYGITIVLWWANLPVVAMVTYVVVLILIILTDTNRITIVTLALAALISLRETSLEQTAPIITIAVVASIPFLVYDIIKTKVDTKNKISIALLIFLGANLLSLLNITSDVFSYGLLGVAQTLGFVILFVYLSSRQKEGDFNYVAKNSAALGIAIGLEFLIYILTYNGDVMGKDIKLGWGMSNSIAMLVTLLIPITYSLYLNNQKNKLPLLAIIIEIVIIIFMLSKGAYLAVIIMLPIIAIILIIQAKDKNTLLIDHLWMFIFLGVSILFIFQIDALYDGFKNYFDRMDDRGWFDDEARIGIYKYALSIFKRFPLFGSGSYTGVPYLVENGYHAGLLHYHNIFLHSMATLGVVGLGSFLYFLFVSIKATLVKNSYNLLVFSAIVAMLVHGLVDNTWYNPLVMIFILTALSVIKKVEKPI